MKRAMLCLTFSRLIASSPQVRADGIAPQARRNFASIDSLDVEHD